MIEKNIFVTGFNLGGKPAARAAPRELSKFVMDGTVHALFEGRKTSSKLFWFPRILSGPATLSSRSEGSL
jgi:hypothetical protein